MRGQKTDAVVPPIIAQASLQEVGILDELVDRHQLDSRHPEVHQIAHYGGMGQPRVGAPQLVRHLRVALREAFHVGLVDHGLVQGGARRPVTLPVEVAGGDDAPGHVRSGVCVVPLLGGIETVAEDPLVPHHLALNGGCVRVEQQFGRVAAKPFVGGPGAIDPQPVALAGPTPGNRPCQICAVCDGSSTRSSSPSASNRQSSIASAISDDTAKLVPSASTRAPRG